MTPCNVVVGDTSASEVHAASIFKVKHTTQHHNPEELDLGVLMSQLFVFLSLWNKIRNTWMDDNTTQLCGLKRSISVFKFHCLRLKTVHGVVVFSLKSRNC
jgi:hypothetical protein